MADPRSETSTPVHHRRRPPCWRARSAASPRSGTAVLHKVIVAAAHSPIPPDAVIAVGNHVSLAERGPFRGASAGQARAVAAEVVALAHLPVRSARQLTNKIVIGWLAHCVAQRSNADLAFHLARALPRAGGWKDAECRAAATIAANYGLPMAAWRPAETTSVLIEDPLPVGEMRYGAMIRDATLPLVLRFAEARCAVAL